MRAHIAYAYSYRKACSLHVNGTNCSVGIYMYIGTTHPFAVADLQHHTCSGGSTASYRRVAKVVWPGHPAGMPNPNGGQAETQYKRKRKLFTPVILGGSGTP